MYKLCGGTLLVLLLHSRKKRITETALLQGMLKVLHNDIYIYNNTLKEQTKKFKICKEHSNLATPFEDATIQNMIADTINNNYNELLEMTSEFINNYIDNDSKIHKDELLIKAVLELIEQDNSISSDQEFYILPNGKTVKKSKILSMTKFYLPSFLLGILYYVIMNIKDNKEGAETYNEWCPKPESGTKRKYIANIGENSKKTILLIKTLEEYTSSELLALTDELSILYVKKIQTEKVDATKIPIIFSKEINNGIIDDYYKLELNPKDYDKAINFIDTYNKLIDYVNKYSHSHTYDELKLLSDIKSKFNSLLDTKFDNQLANDFFYSLQLKVVASPKINIYTIRPPVRRSLKKLSPLFSKPLSYSTFSSLRKMPILAPIIIEDNINEQTESDTPESGDNNRNKK